MAKLRRSQPWTAAMVVAVGFGLGGFGLGRHGRVKADVGFVATPAMQAASTLQTAFGQAVDRVMPATVSIETEEATGSGFIITSSGYILTNDHVITGAQEIAINLPDRDKPLPAKLIGTDPLSDVAVLKIEAPGPLPVAPMGNSDEVAVGQWAIAIGSPMDLDQTVTIGVISATGRLTGITKNKNEDFIQTDAAINPGNSGGPLVNCMGQVIGISNHILSGTGESTGLGFAIPINTARAVANQIIANGRMVRATIECRAVPLSSEAIGALAGVSGHPVELASVRPSGPAAAAGLQPGDIMVAIDGHALRGVEDWNNRIALRPPGQQVGVTVWRGGNPTDVMVRPEVAPDPLGVDVLPITPRIARKYRLKALHGVVILAVEPGSVAEHLGLQVRMVIESVGDMPAADGASLAEAWEAAMLTKQPFTMMIDNQVVRISR